MKSTKKLTLTLVVATVLTAGLAFAEAPEIAEKGETAGCDNHSGACGVLCKAEVAEVSVGAIAKPASFELEAAGCDVHSGACGTAVVSAAAFESGRTEEAPVNRSRSYSDLQSEIDRLLAVIDFEG